MLKEIIPGRSMLSLMLERVERSKHATQIIVATPDTPQDQAIVEESTQAGADTFCGDEHDVLRRYVDAALVFDSDIVVRLCADSPLHDAQIIDSCIELYLSHQGEVDYVSNLMPESFPYGTAVEVFPTDVLLRIDQLTTDPAMREHVTPYIHHNPEQFKIMNLQHKTDLSHLRWAVDTAEDFAFVKSVYRAFYETDSQFSWLQAVEMQLKASSAV